MQFESLWGELYNTDRERGGRLSPAYPSHLFLNSSPDLQLHQSIKWFKWIKEAHLFWTNCFFLVKVLFISSNAWIPFLWSPCWKHSSLSGSVVANISTQMLKLAHFSDHQQVVGSCCAVTLEDPVHLAHAKVCNQFFSSTREILNINSHALSRSRRKGLKWKLQALVDWWFSFWTLQGSRPQLCAFLMCSDKVSFHKSCQRGAHTKNVLILSM